MDEEWLQFKDQIYNMGSTASTTTTEGPQLGKEIKALFAPFFKSVSDWETTGRTNIGGYPYLSSDGAGSPWELAEGMIRDACVQALSAACQDAMTCSHGQCTAVRRWFDVSDPCFTALEDGGELRRRSIQGRASVRHR